MTKALDVLLLLALPASGKSEVRRYLSHLEATVARSDMCIGPMVQLDDYPYVHLMRRASQELIALGSDPVFFESDIAAWRDARDWLTLIHLLNEDFAIVTTGGERHPDPSQMLDRIDRARMAAGADPPFRDLPPRLRSRLEERLIEEIGDLMHALPGTAHPEDTIVIEFARGGPDGASPPLPHPLGYAASLAALDTTILSRAAILYVWVEPEQSRQRNRERARPQEDASILHHGVPDLVMLQDYGTDDVAWLESQARQPRSIRVGDRDIPLVRLDNREDRTSFLREDPALWPADKVKRLHHDLSEALCNLARLADR